MGLASVLLGRWRVGAANDDSAPTHCPCTHSLVMHWFSLSPPISSETAPSCTKTGLYRCAHYVNNSSPSLRTQPPPCSHFLCWCIGSRRWLSSIWGGDWIHEFAWVSCVHVLLPRRLHWLLDFPCMHMLLNEVLWLGLEHLLMVIKFSSFLSVFF